jgi:hypothetical protein
MLELHSFRVYFSAKKSDADEEIVISLSHVLLVIGPGNFKWGVEDVSLAKTR